MIGTLTTPTIASTALARSARDRSSMALRTPIYPRYKNSSNRSEVSLGSHSQYVPHIGRPQSIPVASASAVNEAPMGAQLAATACATFIRQIRPTAALVAMTTYTINDSHAAGA